MVVVVLHDFGGDQDRRKPVGDDDADPSVLLEVLGDDDQLVAGAGDLARQALVEELVDEALFLFWLSSVGSNFASWSISGLSWANSIVR